MIKAEKGTVEIKGEINEILTDFEMTGRAMKEVLTREMGEEKAKEEWEKAIKNSEKSVEERAEEINQRNCRRHPKNDSRQKMRRARLVGRAVWLFPGRNQQEDAEGERKMIKIKNGKLELEGMPREIEADYTTITRAVRKNLAKIFGKENADKQIDRMVTLARMEVGELVELCLKGESPEEKEELKRILKEEMGED